MNPEHFAKSFYCITLLDLLDHREMFREPDIERAVVAFLYFFFFLNTLNFLFKITDFSLFWVGGDALGVYLALSALSCLTKLSNAILPMLIVSQVFVGTSLVKH